MKVIKINLIQEITQFKDGNSTIKLISYKFKDGNSIIKFIPKQDYIKINQQK